MESFAPILGLSMISVGFVLFLVCLGGLAYYYWPRSYNRTGQRLFSPEANPDDHTRERQL